VNRLPLVRVYRRVLSVAKGFIEIHTTFVERHQLSRLKFLHYGDPAGHVSTIRGKPYRKQRRYV
jgi:hypothetical protein